MKRLLLFVSLFINGSLLNAMHSGTDADSEGSAGRGQTARIITLRLDGGAVTKALQDDGASRRLKLQLGRSQVTTSTRISQTDYDTAVIDGFLRACVEGDVDLDALGVHKQMAALTKVLLGIAVEQEQAKPGSVQELAALKRQ